MTQMPGTVLAARIILTVQWALGIFGLAMLLSGLFSDVGLLVLLLLPLVVVVFLGVLIFRWSSRRAWVRWSAVGVEALQVVAALVPRIIDGDLTWMVALSAGLLPVPIVVLLLLPDAPRWFDR